LATAWEVQRCPFERIEGEFLPAREESFVTDEAVPPDKWLA